MWFGPGGIAMMLDFMCGSEILPDADYVVKSMRHRALHGRTGSTFHGS